MTRVRALLARCHPRDVGVLTRLNATNAANRRQLIGGNTATFYEGSSISKTHISQRPWF